jgi:hypothetical protein
MIDFPAVSVRPSLLGSLVRGRPLLAHIAAACIVAAAVAVRLFLGVHTNLDPDEATEAVTALRILHGHLALMESSGRYLGALDSYFLAPFIALLGPTALAARLAEAAVGGVYVALVYALGRRTLPGGGGALVAASLAAVFPLYAVTFGLRARTYGLVLVLEALLLLLTIRLAWPGSDRPARPRAWAAGGLVAGLSVWTHPLLALPVAAGLLAVLARAPIQGWRAAGRGLGWAGAAALFGYLPWLAYNTLVSPLGSLRHLYSPAAAYTTSPATAARFMLSTELPIFVGARGDFCGAATAPPMVVGMGLAVLAVAVLWQRRASLTAVVSGRSWAIEPVDLVLAVAPLALLATTVGPFNALFCEPRYLMPLAVPLVFAAALTLTAALPWRLLGLLLLAGWLAAVAPVALASTGLRPGAAVPPPLDLAAVAQTLQADPPEALWADYQLARPVQYLSGDRFPVGEYAGYVGFSDAQRAAYGAAHPSWLFAAGDPVLPAFRAECGRRGITYRESQPAPGLVLLAGLSARLTPDDLHLSGQRLDQV